jgi:hypothetical protein
MLQHVRAVGAEHNQLAMGHVDDARGSVDDGQSERGDEPDTRNTDAEYECVQNRSEIHRHPFVAVVQKISPAAHPRAR